MIGFTEQKIKVKKSINGDSRTANNLEINELRKATVSHIRDVSNGLLLFANILGDRGHAHDHTKMERMDDFFNALNSGNVKESDWYKRHITEERHHLKSYVPEDVNLIDVLEHLVDCSMAGKTRSGEAYDLDLAPELIMKAYENTVKQFWDTIEVIDE